MVTGSPLAQESGATGGKVGRARGSRGLATSGGNRSDPRM